MSPRLETRELALSLSDCSRGLLSGMSERGVARPTWLSGCENLYGRPYRAKRVRPGSRDISTATLSTAPHSLMGYYSSGGNKLFVGAGAAIIEAQAAAYPSQTLPAGYPGSSDIWSHTNLDGVLIAAQRNSGLPPLMYDGGWKGLSLPTPTEAITFGADTAGGSVDAGDHYYRIRWRFAKGSSLAGPVSAVHTVGANKTVNFTAGFADPPAPHGGGGGDYIGWTMERTKVNGTALGPFWFVKDGTGTTPSDTASDASLGYMADEGLHGQPPTGAESFDGVTAFAGLLWGWRGSKLYASRDIGDLEATGIANFDADDLFQISKDDGDTIQVCVVVLDELLILKKRSVHVISGTDRDSFTLSSVVYADPARGSEAGCAGPRAACVIGGKAYFWGDSGGMFVYSRGGVSPFGWVEAGRYLDDANPAAFDNLLLINHQGNYILAFYPRGSSTIADEQVVYDARFKQFWHWKGWAARDAIELKGGLFSNATMVFCDPTNLASFIAIADGATITGSGIPGATTVVGAVLAGATSLVISAAATLTAQNVTLTIAGIPTTRCNTTSGSTTVTIGEYHLWAAFEGVKDKRTSAGTGGVAISISEEWPWLDFGMPDEWKDLDRVSIAADGPHPNVTVSIETDPAGGATAITLPAKSGTGNDWSLDVDTNPNVLEWDVGDWASVGPTDSGSGVPGGTIGKRFKLTLSAAVDSDYRPTGIDIVAVLLPDKEW